MFSNLHRVSKQQVLARSPFHESQRLEVRAFFIFSTIQFPVGAILFCQPLKRKMFDKFPFNNLETFKFSLLSLPFVYEKVTENECKDLLTRRGDFLVELGDSPWLLLHLRSDEQIITFQIKLCVVSSFLFVIQINIAFQLHDPDRIGFSFGGKEFTTLPGLISHFCSTKFLCNGNNLKLRSAIYRKTCEFYISTLSSGLRHINKLLFQLMEASDMVLS